MSQENVELVRARYAQFASGDFSSFAEYPDDLEFVTDPAMPDAGTYRGEAARRWTTAWVESFDQLAMEATEIVDAGDKVVVAILQRGRPHGSQAVVEGRWWQVLTFRQSELARSELFADRADALKAVGLAE
jgi:ketosteroid isomerase-like protein